MPVFTILSGYLYGIRRVVKEDFLVFSIKKIRRLGVPLIVLTFFTLIGKYWIYGINPDWFRAFFWPYQHFWFLQALLIVFALISVIDIFFKPNVFILFLGVLLMSFLSAFFPLSGPFSIGQALYLMPFFVMGIFIFESKIVFIDKSIMILFPVVAFFLWVWHLLGVYGKVGVIERNSILGTMSGIFACISLLKYMPKFNFLHNMGHYSYSIYLWHSICLAAARMVIWMLGVGDVFVVFFVSSMGGLLGPILLHKIFIKHSFFSSLMLGVINNKKNA